MIFKIYEYFYVKWIYWWYGMIICNICENDINNKKYQVLNQSLFSKITEYFYWVCNNFKNIDFSKMTIATEIN